MLAELLLGALCLGALAGVMGPFLVVRRLSLVSDALAHALVPGLLIAFVLSHQRSFWILGLGAWLSSLAAAYMIAWLSRGARIREDSAIGIVLSGFFAIGALVLGYIQKGAFENKAGLEHFFLGQMAALSSSDIRALLLASLITFVVIVGIYPRLRVLSFDLSFSLCHDAHSKRIERIFYFLLVMVLVLGIHAAGVLLISALLVIPAATALLFTRRLTPMVGLSAVLGALSTTGGTYLSAFRANLPTGALVVLVATTLFLVSFLFVSRESLLAKLLRRRARERQLRRENSLKALYQMLEFKNFQSESVHLREFASKRNQTLEEARFELRNLQSAGLAELDQERQNVSLSPQGWVEACSIVRNHRLWELYLCLFENKSAQEVHEEAEFTEHHMSEATVARVEKMLKFPDHDPHGKSIPSVRDMALYAYRRAPGSGGEGAAT